MSLDVEVARLIDATRQEVCDAFTRDKPSLAILGQSSPLIRDCTRKAHMLDLFDGDDVEYALDKADWERQQATGERG